MYIYIYIYIILVKLIVSTIFINLRKLLLILFVLSLLASICHDCCMIYRINKSNLIYVFILT